MMCHSHLHSPVQDPNVHISSHAPSLPLPMRVRVSSENKYGLKASFTLFLLPSPYKLLNELQPDYVYHAAFGLPYFKGQSIVGLPVSISEQLDREELYVNGHKGLFFSICF